MLAVLFALVAQHPGHEMPMTMSRGVLGIPEVRHAIAAFRGERAPLSVRGDPTV